MEHQNQRAKQQVQTRIMEKDEQKSRATASNSKRPRGLAGAETVILILLPSAEKAVRYVEQAVLTAREAGFQKNEIVVIDTSPNYQAFKSDCLRKQTGYIYAMMPSELTFSMLQNVAATLAEQWEFEYYFWQHADVVIFSHGDVQNQTSSFASLAKQYVHEAPSDWAVLFYGYDLFAAYKTSVLRRI